MTLEPWREDAGLLFCPGCWCWKFQVPKVPILRLESLALAVVQFLAHIVVERGDVGRAQRGGLRIIVGTLSQGIEVGSGKAGIEPPGGQAGIALQRLAKLAAVDAQIRLENVFDGKPGVLVQLLGDRAARPRRSESEPAASALA